MAMSKAQMQEWPWNNRPSPKHVWTVKGNNDHCARCKSTYIRAAGGTGPVYCFPSKEWLAEHPGDTMLGPVKTPFG